MAFVSSGQVQVQVQPSRPGEAAHTADSLAISCSVCTRELAYTLPSRPKASLYDTAKALVHHARAKNRPAASAATRVTITASPVQSQTATLAPVSTPAPRPQGGPGWNPFPYGTCTWWADQRYFQLHGTFVPWHTQADAWQWTTRAYQFGWHVSNTPVLGAIINLQPYVQGAYGLGHVAVVEKILSNGHVIASNMAWGANPQQVTYVEFSPGPGVTFIYQ